MSGFNATGNMQPLQLPTFTFLISHQSSDRWRFLSVRSATQCITSAHMTPHTLSSGQFCGQANHKIPGGGCMHNEQCSFRTPMQAIPR